MALALWAPTAAAVPDTITDLGTLPAGTFSQAAGINATGQVAGGGDTEGLAEFRAFLWDPLTGFQNLGTLSGDSFAYGVNAGGQVVGRTRMADGRDHAFVWDPLGGIRDLGTLAGASISGAYAINSFGQVVGESNVPGGGFAFRAVMWDALGRIVDLGILVGGSYSVAYAINDLGQVVGEADGPDGSTRGFVWDPVGGMRDLGTLPGGTVTVARAINGPGQVVGWGDTAGGATHAFLWDPVGGIRDLGALPGGTASFAFGVNDQGLVVGEAVLADGATTHAFVWEPASGMRDLGTLPGGSFSAAFGINGANQVAGEATVAAGESRAVRWQLNRQPAAQSQSVSTAQDTPVGVTLSGSDPDGDPLAFSVVAGPSQGRLSGTPPTLTYTPGTGYAGADSFTFSVTDGRATSAVATVSISVLPRGGGGDDGLPGRVHGQGYVDADGRRHHFEFRVGARTAGDPHGRLVYHQSPPDGEAEHHEPEAGEARHRRIRFVSTAVTAAVFSDAPGVVPGRQHEPAADTVVFSGTGRWKGMAGYTFEARATDAGEPGRGHDSFALTIRDPAGAVVTSVAGTLAGGNIQSLRVKPMNAAVTPAH